MPEFRRPFEEFVDELNLTPNIRSAHPPNLPLPQHVHRLITLNGSLRRLEFSEPLLGVHPPFDGSVVLLENVVQILYRSMPATAAKYSFLLYVGDGRAVDRCQVRIDDPRLRMGQIAQRLAKQPFGGVGIAQLRKIVPQPLLLQCGPITLYPAPYRRMICFQPTSSSSSSTSRSDNEYRRYQRTAHRMRAGYVCRHLKTLVGLPSQDPFRLEPAQRRSCNTTITERAKTFGERPGPGHHISSELLAGGNGWPIWSGRKQYRIPVH